MEEADKSNMYERNEEGRKTKEEGREGRKEEEEGVRRKEKEMNLDVGEFDE
jgi:hypothetical protein